MAPFSAQSETAAKPKSTPPTTTTSATASSEADSKLALDSAKESKSAAPVMQRKHLNGSAAQVSLPFLKSAPVDQVKENECSECLAEDTETPKEEEYAREIVWKNVFLFTLLHSNLLYAGYITLFYQPVRTILFGM